MNQISEPRDPKDSQVRVTIEGPFGPVQQVSVPMRPSIAVTVAGDILKLMQTGHSPHITNVEIVRVVKRFTVIDGDKK